MPTTTSKNFTPNSKDIRYLNRDFTQLRQSLMDFAKTYFPNTYNDFSTASPGTMFIEMAAYVGDVLSYYTDYAFKESMIQNSTERRNIISLANYLGYKVKPIQGAIGTIELFQLCPAKENAVGVYVPDTDYALRIKEDMQVSNNAGSYYVLNDSVDFAVSTSLSPRTDAVYSRNQDGTPQFFLLQKTGKIAAGKVSTKTITVNSPTPFFQIYLNETNVLGIIDVVDSNNNEWHEVDFLAQELVPIAIPNDSEHEGTLSTYKDSVPYILKFLRTPNRFTVNVDSNNFTYLEFGAGTEGFSEEFVTFDSKLIGIGLRNISNYNIPFDPANFLKNKTYGVAPSNTTLTIRYLTGGGINSNSPSNAIRNVVSVEFDNPTDGLPPEKNNLLNTVKNSLQVNNSIATVGGKEGETDNEVKMNATANFATQNRAVTKDDYLVRIYSLPPKFGSIAKAQVITDTSLNVGVNRVLSGTINSENIATVTDNATANYFRKISTVPTAFGAKTITWDGKNASGVLVPDGIYNVFVESSYCNPEPANNQHWIITNFSFTKGTTAVHLTPTGPANFSNISLDWVPSTVGVDEVIENSTNVVFPNPSTGIININYVEASNIKIENILGAVVYEENVSKSGSKTIDLSKHSNGTYFVAIKSAKSNTIQKYKVLLNK